LYYFISDVVKTRMQAFPDRYDNGVFAAAKDIIASEGVGYLLTGLGQTVIGYGVEGALKFGCYESLKIAFRELIPNSMEDSLLSSVIAGALASLLLVSCL
jgi:solute carrier family 25 (mitochondrial phosphate transporter), member 3